MRLSLLKIRGVEMFPKGRRTQQKESTLSSGGPAHRESWVSTLKSRRSCGPPPAFGHTHTPLPPPGPLPTLPLGSHLPAGNENHVGDHGRGAQRDPPHIWGWDTREHSFLGVPLLFQPQFLQLTRPLSRPCCTALFQGVRFGLFGVVLLLHLHTQGLNL